MPVGERSDLLSMKEMAAELNVSRATIYREQEDGKLRFVKIRSRRFTERTELERYRIAARGAA